MVKKWNGRSRNRQTDRKTDKQIERKTDRQTKGQTNRYTNSLLRNKEMTRICTLTKCNRNESSIIQYMPVLFFYNILTYLGVCELEFPGNVIAKRPFLYQLNKNDTIQARSLGRPVMMALHLITNK